MSTFSALFFSGLYYTRAYAGPTDTGLESTSSSPPNTAAPPSPIAPPHPPIHRRRRSSTTVKHKSGKVRVPAVVGRSRSLSMTMTTGGAVALATDGGVHPGVVRIRTLRMRRTVAPSLPPPNAPLPAPPPSPSARVPRRQLLRLRISVENHGHSPAGEEELFGPEFTTKLLTAMETPSADSPIAVKSYPWMLDHEVKKH